MNAYEKIKSGTVCNEIDALTEGIKDLNKADESLKKLHEIAAVVFEFLEVIEAKPLDATLREQLESITENSVEVMDSLEHFYVMISQKQTPNMTVPRALKAVSNLHLILNSFSVFAKEVDT